MTDSEHTSDMRIARAASDSTRFAVAELRRQILAKRVVTVARLYCSDSRHFGALQEAVREYDKAEANR